MAITEDEDKNAKIREIAGMFAKLGASEDEVKKLADSLADLAYEPDEGQKPAEDDNGDNMNDLDSTDNVTGEDDDDDVSGVGVKDITEDGDDDEGDELDAIARDAIKACGYDSESEEFQRAFAEGVKYGERKEKQEPKKLDEEHESEGEKRHLEGAQDAMLRRLGELERREQIRTAIAECSKVLGRVRVNAFDSAEGVYLEALKQKGVPMRGITKKNARQIYLGVVKGEAVAARRREIATDGALKTSDMPDIAKGINVKIS